ncbi:hypothetical protein ABIE44_001664 [Marmoricola sp. OAE513]|uniref:SCO6745 family protein n=1 Tax=Marmoricola sp. OAE513 TaxID=2817894 RepID=UPI001AE564EA
MTAMSPERELWSLYEPVHAIVYFDPSVFGCLGEVGLHGFWNGYFAGRAAPMGAVGPEVVTAAFFGFAPRMVAKAIPKVWGRVTPEQAIEVRLEAVRRTLAPLIEAGSTDDVRRVTDALVTAAEAAAYDGRTLGAAWRGVPVPEDLPARLWWATTALREHRGDGHVLAATYAGLSGLETSVTHCVRGPLTRELLQPNRGWTDEEWDAAVQRLTDRGLVEPQGLTPSGEALRDQVEGDTDRLSARTSPEDLPLFRSVLGGLARAIADAGALPHLNPMGVPIPE